MTLSLSTVLLFALTVPFIMTFRIGPGDTPYPLFGLIFISILGSVFADLFIPHKEAVYFRIKSFFLWFAILSSVGMGFVSAIIVRHQTHPVYQIHDIILQLEAAIRFLLDGVNPYSTTYFGTFLEQWHYSATDVNPALYHFVMEPFYLLFSIPFYGVFIKTAGFFDGRIPLFFLFFATLLLAWRLVKDKEKKLQFVALLALNPATLAYTLEGRSDAFMFAFLFAALYLLHINKKLLAGVVLGMTFMIKQSVWPLFPFYAAYLFFMNKKNIGKTVKDLIPFFITSILIALPFLIWDAGAYINSTVFYLSGNTEFSYPISGYGFSMLLHQLGVIRGVHDSFPFTPFQAVICIPLLIFLIKYQMKHNTTKSLIVLYAIFLFIYWYFSRYFNNSHIAFISTLLITSFYWPDIREEK